MGHILGRGITMSENIGVINYALRVLAANRITSIEDEDNTAQIMKDLYHITRDSMLEEAEWSFATRRFLPAKSTDAPEWGWSAAYPIPSDIIRVTEVDRNNYTESMQRSPVPHEVEGNSILCDADTIYCKGIRRMEDEGSYSPLFNKAFALHLALIACLPIKANNASLQLIGQMYDATMAKAKSRDGMQSSTRRMRNKSVIRARAGSRVSGW